MPAKLPGLPSGWNWVDDNAPETMPTPDEAHQNAGSVLRTIMGPRRPEPEPMSPALHTAMDVAGMIIPHTPEQIGKALAATILTGGAGMAVRTMGQVGSKLVPIAESIGPSAISRVLGMGAAGGIWNQLSGGNPVSGALDWMTTQMGGEGLSKVSRWLGMNQQAKDLAASDPKRLGEVVTNIIPNLGPIKSANDFHAAFNNNGAQLVASQAYRDGMAAIEAKVGQQPIQSTLLAQMRGAGAQPMPGTVPGLVGGVPGAPAGMPGAIGQPAASYSFSDAVHTLQRLRRSGWNQDEIRQGLGAMDARDAANTLSQEITSQIAPAEAKAFVENDGMYARAQSLINYISDPALLKKDGELNIPRLQDKFKADGYGQRQSLQMTADAMALKDAIFRGDPNMPTDIPGEAGKIFDHFRMHFGIVPTVYPRFPKVGSYAGQQPYGLTPMAGSRMSQLLGRGIDQARKPISLAADNED